jgi:uncharacterized protein
MVVGLDRKELDLKLLKILACPACEDRPPVRIEAGELICDECGRAYPVRHDIPVMLVDEARAVGSKQGAGQRTDFRGGGE